MGRNLQFQFKNAIDSCFGKNAEGGFDKHAMKAAGENTLDKVFSYNERQGLLETSSQLGRYIKENYPDIKQISQITPEHVQKFLNSKSSNNNNLSLGTIKSRLNKLNAVCTKRYSAKENSFVEGVKTPKSDKVDNCRKNVSVSDADWDKIKNAMNGSTSKANILIELAEAQMLRVESVTNLRVKDFDFKNKQITIVDDKGKRDRVIKMKDVELCKRACGVKNKEDKISKILPDSVNKQLKRLMEKAGILKRYKDAKTGVHALRKRCSIKLAIELKDNGYDKEKILAEVSRMLGHGIKRRDVLKKYLDEETIAYISR